VWIGHFKESLAPSRWGREREPWVGEENKKLEGIEREKAVAVRRTLQRKPSSLPRGEAIAVA